MKILDSGTVVDMDVVAHDPTTRSVVLRNPRTFTLARFTNGYPQEVSDPEGHEGPYTPVPRGTEQAERDKFEAAFQRFRRR